MDAENCSWSIKAVLGTCQVSSSSILSDSKSISFIRKNGNILRGGETMEVKGFFPAYRKNRRLVFILFIAVVAGIWLYKIQKRFS